MRQIAAILAASLMLTACQTYGAQPNPVADAAAATASESAAPTYVTAICGECHAVTDNAVSPNPQAPGFADIANSPGLTRDTLVTFLSDAHNYPMQMDVDLVEEDIELIADYMLTLQSEDYVRRPG
jgi:cytochrome c553